MKKVVIAVCLTAIISGCGNVAEAPTATASPDVEVTPTPTTTVEIVESEPPVESEVPIESEPPVVESEPVFYLSDYERWVAECMVMGESGSESYEGQVLVAQCILNACLKDRLMPSTVRVRYKYSGWHESPTESVKKAVSAVFDEGYQITNEPILYFYAPKYAVGRFHETQRFIMEVGGHRFFAEWKEWN